MAVRTQRPVRNQVELVQSTLDDLVADDHGVRYVWAFVEQIDISPLYEGVKSVEGRAGRVVTDRRLLLALWLWATIDGVGSARAIERYTREHNAYQWLCGGVSVCHSLLSRFRVEHGGFLNDLLTKSTTALIEQGVVQVDLVAHDGVRVRASAGAASFRREATLERVKAHVEALRRQLDEDPGEATKRQLAARKRAAAEKLARVEQALATVPELRATKKRNGQPEESARVSTSDPEARVMKMADGGYRPAYNGQYTVDPESGFVLGVDITNLGSDMSRLTPTVDQIEERYGTRPEKILVDGGFANLAQITATEQAGTQVYAPPQKPRNGQSPHERKPTDSDEVAEWRARMGTEAAKKLYSLRYTIEWVNAVARNHGLRQFLVRGVKKAKSVLLLHALAHNIQRLMALGQLLGKR